MSVGLRSCGWWRPLHVRREMPYSVNDIIQRLDNKNHNLCHYISKFNVTFRIIIYIQKVEFVLKLS